MLAKESIGETSERVASDQEKHIRRNCKWYAASLPTVRGEVKRFSQSGSTRRKRPDLIDRKLTAIIAGSHLLDDAEQPTMDPADLERHLQFMSRQTPSLGRSVSRASSWPPLANGRYPSRGRCHARRSREERFRGGLNRGGDWGAVAPRKADSSRIRRRHDAWVDQLSHPLLPARSTAFSSKDRKSTRLNSSH